MADLTYDPAAPQEGDSELVIDHKTAVNIGRLANAMGISKGYVHINSNATTLVKSGTGFLNRIIINNKGSGSNTATIYDSLTGSGTVIGVLDTTVADAMSIQYGIAFANGLTIVTATGTSADMTVAFS
jgi:hypothetical protein